MLRAVICEFSMHIYNGTSGLVGNILSKPNEGEDGDVVGNTDDAEKPDAWSEVDHVSQAHWLGYNTLQSEVNHATHQNQCE